MKKISSSFREHSFSESFVLTKKSSIFKLARREFSLHRAEVGKGQWILALSIKRKIELSNKGKTARQKSTPSQANLILALSETLRASQRVLVESWARAGLLDG